MTKPIIAAGWIVSDDEQIWGLAETKAAVQAIMKEVNGMEVSEELTYGPATQALIDEFELHGSCAGWSVVDGVACTCEEAADHLNEEGSEK